MPCFFKYIYKKGEIKKKGKVKLENNEIDHLAKGETKGGKVKGEKTHL